MRKIEGLRASLIHNEYETGESSIVVTDNLKRFLINSPSVIESGSCAKNDCLGNDRILCLPVVSINNEVFADSLDNLERAIVSNFPAVDNCPKCGQLRNQFTRSAGMHLFIDVIMKTIHSNK